MKFRIPVPFGPGGELQEGERAVEHWRPLPVVRAPAELERDDRESGDVVDAVPRLPARDHADGVLDDPDVVDERPEVIRPDGRELQLDDRDRHRRGAGGSCLLEDDRRLGGDRRPGEIGSEALRLRARRGERLGALDEVADRLLDRLDVVERNERPRAGGEHVLREQVRRGDRGATGGKGEGQRTRRDLLRVAVRRQEDVRRVQQVGQLGDGEEAVVELDVIRDPEVDGTTLEKEPILLSFEPRHLRWVLPATRYSTSG